MEPFNELETNSLSILVYYAHHVGVKTIMKMFHQIQRITKDYNKKYPPRSFEKTKFDQIWDEID
jgi:hypothetical protein